MENIRAIPFPDIVVQTESTKYWAASEEFFVRADKNHSVLELFDTISSLATLLKSSLCIGAQFKVENDPGQELSDQNLEKNCEKLFGKAENCSNVEIIAGKPLAEELLHHAGLKSRDYLKAVLLQPCELTAFNESNKNALVHLIYGQVVKDLDHGDIVFFLSNIFRKGAAFLKKHFSLDQVQTLYSFVNTISENIDDFNGLPIPVGLRLTADQGRIKTTFAPMRF